jgi:hypothetical protein
MIDPSLPLHAAIVSALKADATLDSLVADRIYDRVPAGATVPYIHLRSMQVIDDGNTCGDAAEVIVDLDVWSEAVGQVQAKTIGKTVVDVLDGPIVISGYRSIASHAQSTTYSTESDGLTTRGAMSFRFLVDEAP